MINIDYIGYQQEFTLLIIRICVQQTCTEFPRPATQSPDTFGAEQWYTEPCRALMAP